MTIPIYGSAEHARQATIGRHPGVQTAMAWLAFTHLPEELQSISRPLFQAALQTLGRIPGDSAELASALNRLVESKDWFMRAGIRSDEGKPGPVPRPDEVVDPPAAATLRAVGRTDMAAMVPGAPAAVGHAPAGDAPEVCPGCGKKLTAHGYHYGTGMTGCSGS